MWLWARAHEQLLLHQCSRCSHPLLVTHTSMRDMHTHKHASTHTCAIISGVRLKLSLDFPTAAMRESISACMSSMRLLMPAVPVPAPVAPAGPPAVPCVGEGGTQIMITILASPALLRRTGRRKTKGYVLYSPTLETLLLLDSSVPCAPHYTRKPKMGRDIPGLLPVFIAPPIPLLCRPPKTSPSYLCMP